MGTAGIKREKRFGMFARNVQNMKYVKICTMRRFTLC